MIKAELLTMRKYFIAGNWKMYKKVDEAVEIAKILKENLKDVKDVDIAICPPFTALYSVNKAIEGSNINLGAQNLWYEPEGAYTGEISPAFLVDVGCRYVIIGHSERRKYFEEKGNLIALKIKSAIEFKLLPIVCMGETLEQREKNQTLEVIKKQFDEAFISVCADGFSNVIIAYEPVWAIGTGKTATPETAEESHKFIRSLIKAKYGSKIADTSRILYGGSVKASNIEEILKKENIDGALVGGASLDPISFTQIIQNVPINRDYS